MCPKRVHICQIGEGRETLLHGVYRSTVKNLTLTFGPKIFHMYSDSQKILGEKTNVKLTLTCVNSVSPKVCKDHILRSLSQLNKLLPFFERPKRVKFPYRYSPPTPFKCTFEEGSVLNVCVFLSPTFCFLLSLLWDKLLHLCLYWSGFKFLVSSNTLHDMLG